ncbi:hypothetical protein [Erythrobacter sp. F6033]|uniref:hypothetical protein n=1 Tax=Erythrobacter sp. F6033 TaxID=2926401 RepID=UPI001FF58BA8|nr:hypothetical protein [Erythrobacter sp. F6033]MCK0129253.1 hypothetical protein [Erythrobacter sp. F6033]
MLAIGLFCLVGASCAQQPLTADSNRAATIANSEGTAEPSAATVLEYKAGQSISFVFPDNREGGEAAVAEYYRRAFPLAESFGLSRDVTLNIDRAIVGEYPATSLTVFSWPSSDAERQFTSHPDWPEIKSLRAKGWDDLRIYSDELEEDLTLRFDPDKFYTLAIAWLNPDRSKDYARYFEIIEDDVGRAGGRFMYKMIAPTFETHAFQGGAPGQLTLVEWDNPDSLRALQQTEKYREAQPFFRSGVREFEFYVLSPGPRTR